MPSHWLLFMFVFALSVPRNKPALSFFLPGTRFLLPKTVKTALFHVVVISICTRTSQYIKFVLKFFFFTVGPHSPGIVWLRAKSRKFGASVYVT